MCDRQIDLLSACATIASLVRRVIAWPPGLTRWSSGRAGGGRVSEMGMMLPSKHNMWSLSSRHLEILVTSSLSDTRKLVTSESVRTMGIDGSRQYRRDEQVLPTYYTCHQLAIFVESFDIFFSLPKRDAIHNLRFIKCCLWRWRANLYSAWTLFYRSRSVKVTGMMMMLLVAFVQMRLVYSSTEGWAGLYRTHLFWNQLLFLIGVSTNTFVQTEWRHWVVSIQFQNHGSWTIRNLETCCCLRANETGQMKYGQRK